ncbi:hypothetical protein ALC60_04962, partial [Trachymyrmex zeteki]
LEELTRRMNQKGHMPHHRPDRVIIGEAVAIQEHRGWQRRIITSINGDRTVPRKARNLTKYLINQEEGRMSIVGTIGEAALVKLDIRSGGDAREYHQINLKETLISLGYAQHSDKLRTGTYPLPYKKQIYICIYNNNNNNSYIL